MIFVTVGAQMSFDRLIRAVDQWALKRGRNDVFAQIGDSSFRPSYIQFTAFLTIEEFKHRCSSAKVIVSHAGTGSIITALQLGKPALIMPRRAELRETRNDHQVGTAERFRRFSSISVAANEEDLMSKLDQIDEMTGSQPIEAYASSALIDAIRDFIADVPARPRHRTTNTEQ
ncbi:MAG: glycosyltransferase [Steroidobacteraceae bacterium]